MQPQHPSFIIADSWLTSAGYYEDTIDKYDDVVKKGAVAPGNNGFLRRIETFCPKNSDGVYDWSKKDWAQLIGGLPTDFTTCASGILHGVSIRFDFTLAKQDFFLMGAISEKMVQLSVVTSLIG